MGETCPDCPAATCTLGGVSAPYGPRDDASDQTDPGVSTENLTIQQVSQLLSVPAPTIRSWERRYGVPLADRSSGGHRRYADAQIDQLRRMRDLIAQGRRPIEAAALVAAGNPTSPGSLVEAFLDAAAGLAADRIARTLDVSRDALGLDRTVDEVLLPAVREIGERWHAGLMDVSHEHLASNTAQAWLSAVQPVTPLRPHSTVVLTCGPNDHHTLALAALGAQLGQRRWDCRMLGARTPAQSLARAVTETDAMAVVLVCQVTAGRRAAVESLRSPELRHRQLFYAGGAFDSSRAREDVPGHYLGTNLTQATNLITATLAAALS